MIELRQQLAAARIRLRGVKGSFELAKAEAEQRAIGAGQAIGKNEKERERALLLAISKDEQYLIGLAAYRQAEAEVDRLEALLEGARDARRAEEWQIRARLADALMRAGVQSDGGDEFDDGIDHALYADVERHLARQEQPDEEFEMPF